jgi:hypothetical protein
MKVKNFAGFMKSRRLNESDDMSMGGWDEGADASIEGDEYAAGYYGANPEDEEEPAEGEGAAEGEEEEEELTLEDLKAMIEDLEERVKKLEPEEEEEPAEGEEGEEGEEPAEGEAAPAKP